MNNLRRMQIKRAIQLLEQAKEVLDGVLDEESNAFDNLPESIQQSSRGEQMEDNVDKLQETIDLIDEAQDALENIE